MLTKVPKQISEYLGYSLHKVRSKRKKRGMTFQTLDEVITFILQERKHTQKTIYTIPEAVQITGKSKQSFYQGIKRGSFPSYVHNGILYIELIDISKKH